MTANDAKKCLDKVINKGRVHFYKPFHIAEVLRRHRIGELKDLLDLESYRSISKRWRDAVSQGLVGRASTSSAKYQDDVFNVNACPPEALAALGKINKATSGGVEAYIYLMFELRVGQITGLSKKLKCATPSTFSLDAVMGIFTSEAGLKRSIDKVFEILVYALFSTIVRALRLQITIELAQPDSRMIASFGDFLVKVVGMKEDGSKFVLPGSMFRLGATNASDRGLDIATNFGPAIQVKHLTLDEEEMSDIFDGITADHVVIVCKDAHKDRVEGLVRQLSLEGKLRGFVTLGDIERWYGACLNEYPKSLGRTLLEDLYREFTTEFPSVENLRPFMEDRGYAKSLLPEGWSIE